MDSPSNVLAPQIVFQGKSFHSSPWFPPIIFLLFHSTFGRTSTFAGSARPSAAALLLLLLLLLSVGNRVRFVSLKSRLLDQMSRSLNSVCDASFVRFYMDAKVLNAWGPVLGCLGRAHQHLPEVGDGTQGAVGEISLEGLSGAPTVGDWPPQPEAIQSSRSGGRPVLRPPTGTNKSRSARFCRGAAAVAMRRCACAAAAAAATFLFPKPRYLSDVVPLFPPPCFSLRSPPGRRSRATLPGVSSFFTLLVLSNLVVPTDARKVALMAPYHRQLGGFRSRWPWQPSPGQGGSFFRTTRPEGDRG